MIPDRLIDRAAEAAADAPYAGESPPHIPIGGMHPVDAQAWRDAARAVIRVVAADIWDEAAEAIWRESGEGWNGEYPYDSSPTTPNPYREKEN